MASSRKKPVADLQARVSACLARHLPTQQAYRLCVGFSGGLDSVVLLHLLASLRDSLPCHISAIHIHHGLSPHADEWADFCMASAARLKIDCQVHRVEVSQRPQLGLEAAARAARYAVFEQVPCDALLLAHHQNDQAETLLLNLLRGSGIKGLAAMPESRLLMPERLLLRPLLPVSRSELQSWAQQQQLTWIEDESNQDQTLNRNYLRHRVFPVLNQAYPETAALFSRSAQHLAEADQLLAEFGKADLQTITRNGHFDLEQAKPLSLARQRNALRCWLAQSLINPDSRAFDELWHVMQTSKSDATPCWVWRKQAVRRYRTRLYITSAHIQSGPDLLLPWQGEITIPVPEWGGQLQWTRNGQIGLDEQFLLQGFRLSPRTGGECLRLAPQAARQTLQHLWQQAATPPWQRISTPLIWIGQQLAAVPGLGIAAEFQQANGWQIRWQETTHENASS